MAVDESEMTQAIAFRAVEGLLGKLDDASKSFPFPSAECGRRRPKNSSLSRVE